MAALQPSIRFTLRLLKVPASLGTTVYRWSTRPLADAGAWSEGRLAKWGAIERSLSTADGDYDITRCDVELDDADGLFRGLLGAPATRIFTGREAAIELLSEAGRAAGTSWRSLFRGHVSGIQATSGRKATLRISDCVGSNFSGFDFEKKLGVRITRQEHPNADDKVVNRIYPIVTGEHSDVGATDENGNAADKGLLPVIDVGDYLLADDGTIVGSDTPLAYLQPPSGLGATVNGTPGTTERSYSVTAVSPYGETTAATVTVSTSAAALSGTDSITLEWDSVDGAVEYRVYGRGTPNTLLVRLNNGETFTDPETTWTDTGALTPGSTSVPQTNTALTDQDVEGQGAFAWGRLILKIGAAAEVQHLYASDLAEGAQPKRVRVAEDRYGSEFLVYGRTGWPHSDPYIEINGIRMGVAYARGAALKHHRDGAVTITWNGCGDEEVGDGTGDTITEAFYALQHVLNEYALKDSGTGYRTGDFGPLEAYSNSVAKLKSSAFDACQDLTATWIGGRGYQASIAITEPISLRDFVRRFCVTFACHLGANHHGQVYPVLIDDSASVTAGRLYHQQINVAKLESPGELDHDAVETKVTFHYDRDTEANKFRVTDQFVEDSAMSAAYGTARERGTRELWFTRDRATAFDSCGRHLTRYAVAPRYPVFRTDLTGLEDELGAQVRLTHYDGIGSTNGDEETPLLVFSHKTLPQAPESVSITGFDLSRILNTALPLLGDKTTIAGNLFDHTNPNEPTAGAYRLR